MEQEKERSIAERIYDSLSNFCKDYPDIATVTLSMAVGAAIGACYGAKEAAIGGFIGGFMGGTAALISAENEKTEVNLED